MQRAGSHQMVVDYFLGQAKESLLIFVMIPVIHCRFLV